MSEGWVKLHRKLQDNPLWTSEPFSKGQAWVDLILIANHTDNFFYKRGNKVNVLRGQVGFSEVGLADRWKWSRTKVRKFLNDLEKEQQIIQQKSTITQVVTIVNYNQYQEKEQQSGQQKDSRKTAERQQKDTNKNVKNDNNVKEQYRKWQSESNNETYKGFVDWLIERDPKLCLSLGDQITEQKFSDLMKMEGATKEKLKIKIMNIEGWRDNRKYKHFYAALKNWMS